MPDRPAPYIKKDPGDIIYSGDWNELQIQAREEIYKDVRSHRHTDGDDGKPVPREGIEPKAIDGTRIDPATAATVRKLTVSGELKVDGKAILGDEATVEKLTVSGELKVDGKAILEDIPALKASLSNLESTKVNRAGDTISGDLAVTGRVRSAGATFVDPVSAHINTDGALYRTGGQVYLTVDDNFYIRDASGTAPFHFQTDQKTLKVGGALVTTANENLHIVRGYVNVDGGTLAGSGFSATRTNTGIYTIAFVPAFSARPTVVCTQHYPTSDSFRNTGGDTRDNAVVIAVNKNQCLIKTGGAGGDAANRRFEFIAVGPR